MAYNRSADLPSIQQTKTKYLLQHLVIHMAPTKSGECIEPKMADAPGRRHYIRMRIQDRFRQRSIHKTRTSYTLICGQEDKGRGKTARGTDQKVVCLSPPMEGLRGQNSSKDCQRRNKA